MEEAMILLAVIAFFGAIRVKNLCLPFIHNMLVLLVMLNVSLLKLNASFCLAYDRLTHPML